MKQITGKLIPAKPLQPPCSSLGSCGFTIGSSLSGVVGFSTISIFSNSLTSIVTSSSLIIKVLVPTTNNEASIFNTKLLIVY